MSDVVGGSYALTLFSPVRPEKVFDLYRTLAGMPSGASSPFDRVAGTHCARWVIIPQLVYEAFGQRPDPLQRPYLLFTANFDGDLDGFLYRLHSGAREAAHSVWGTCVGYPGHDDAQRFVRYLKAHQVRNTLVVAAYPDSTVADVRRSLALHQRFVDLVIEVQGQPPEVLVERFRKTFPADRQTTAGQRRRSNGSVPEHPRAVPPGSGRSAIAALAVRARGVLRRELIARVSEGGGGQGPDLANLQRLVKGYGRRFGCAVYLFARVVQPEMARRWLREAAEGVTAHHQPDGGVHPPPLSVAFTFAGLRSLGVPESSLATFPAPFREGMAARADLLGDTGESAPRNWDEPFACAAEEHRPRAAVHLLVAVYAHDAGQIAERGRQLEDQMTASGLEIVGRQEAARFPNGREHFGFVDGIAQPLVLGLSTGRSVPSHAGRPIAAGEFLLGHADEEGLVGDAPSPCFLAREGTYLVYRKLSQHVAAFERLLRAGAERFQCDREWLAARLMGRWREGTPVELSPDHKPDHASGTGARDVEFGYHGDPDGRRCPLGAHVRRANPRDGLAAGEAMVSRHRLLRRGIPYGPRLEGDTPDGRDRGLIFLALVADIERQFEFVQRQWLNDGNVLGLGADRDAIAGSSQGSSKLVIQGAPPRCLLLSERLTTTRAGEYFFLPGVDALRCMASGWTETVTGCNRPTNTRRWRR
jgi:Dyp-type peroxidase family